ncbi:hypothetical protein BS47DRAFT_1335171 [Hydnum rufescens UP504]|uniref:Uncharacterized protein n=1 Tax=Hydnum rufescens UP504 TaxID=1448309 RepID=A0A9P6BB76_9AGAM|nr:hypothetical protein BS47DRAFT_1354648 [Hydnum rufescens UP504]KAF9521088.1 hypothetical protein BS47DRAFT_1335171 [Hydnum rufescens UP504]
MNLGTTPLTKLSDSARVKLGLIDVDDDLDGEEISVDDEYSAYIGSSTRRIQATQPVLTFWQVCPFRSTFGSIIQIYFEHSSV